MSVMNLDEIEILVNLVAEANVSEVTVRANGRLVTVRKAAHSPVSASVAPSPMTLSRSEEPARPIASDSPPEPHWICAPMVGIFHPARTPIAVGTRVEKGQTVGAIESMKLMNDVRAEQSGIVKEVLIEAGMPVEYGQRLFALVDSAKERGGERAK